MVVVHDFKQQLAFSQAASDESFWDQVYRRAFPNLVAHVTCRGNTRSQHMGVDRVIHLANAKTLYVDEKKRRPNLHTGEEYNDILLEYLSNDQTNAPGWIVRDLAIDYLAYAFMRSKRVYLFPWCMLQRAWRKFGGRWRAMYPNIQARNNGYTTWSVAVPIDVLRRAISTASIIQL